MKIADSYINGYLKDDIQTKGRIIYASKEHTPLFDLNHNLFAYIVPLMEGEKEIGYITVGAIDDGYDFYEIFISDNAAQKLVGHVQDLKAEKSADTNLVFIPPMTYLAEVPAAKQTEYYEVSSTRGIKDQTAYVNSGKKSILERYDGIRSTSNKQHMEQLMSASLSSVTPENVALPGEASYQSFVSVEYNPGVYSYGGDQSWYATSTKQDRGCGPVAAANITNYFAKVKNPSVFGALYAGQTYNKTDFVAHMDALYSYVNPSPLGEISVNGFASAVEKYAKDRNVTLNRVTSTASFTLDNTANYIKAGLSANSPVATLNLSKFSDYAYEWHWMTITKYYRDSADNRAIAVSTWGERRSINYRDHFNAISNFFSLGGGFMYFQ